MSSRRNLLQHAAYATALFGVPLTKAATTALPLPPDALYASNPEAYWLRLRTEQFYLPDWRTFLNTGSLGVAPKPVVQTMIDSLEQGAGLITDQYPRWGYETLDPHREELAKFFGCKKDELAIMHNATEAMSTIAAGIDLKPGDEVLLTDQEHPSGRGPWYQRQARQGIVVREVPLPIPPRNAGQVADAVISAIGPRTKVLSFSGILTTTGLVMPVREICSAARAKGVITVVDGAHLPGQMPVNISSFGCDYLAASPHKWMFAPAGSGLLYIREENLERLWPTVVSGSWDDKKLKAARFMMMGANNRAVVEGTLAGLHFLQALGPERVYARIHQMAASVRERAAQVPYLELLTPPDNSLYAGLVTFAFKGKNTAPFAALCRKRRIWIYGGEHLRVATHVHTRPSDLDALFGAMRETLG